MRLTKPELKPAAQRYVAMTLDVIAETGTSVGVNLREVSRRLGHAHTNVYNYFATYDDLLEHALRWAILDYADAMAANIRDHRSAQECFRQFSRNLVEWSIQNPGLHRFITTDPLDPDALPPDIVENVTAMKAWIADLLRCLAGPQLHGVALRDLRDILLGYLDGEVSNLVNGRILPGEDPAERVLKNTELLFVLLVTHRTRAVWNEAAVWAVPQKTLPPAFEIVPVPVAAPVRR